MTCMGSTKVRPVASFVTSSCRYRFGCGADASSTTVGRQSSTGGRVSRIRKLRWVDLQQAPASPGVYAWYYEPEITDFDLDAALIAIRERTAAGDRVGAEAVVNTLLSDHVMSYFRQDPFDVVLSGPLKPRHVGSAEHDQRLSPALVQRLLEDPDRLRPLRDILGGTAPYFASPLYVGMSDNLRSRLARHRTLIEKFRREGFRRAPADATGQSEEAGFARRVVGRRIPPDRLFVMTCETDQVVDLHLDLENLFNRMYYPILGRN